MKAILLLIDENDHERILQSSRDSGTNVSAYIRKLVEDDALNSRIHNSKTKSQLKN